MTRGDDAAAPSCAAGERARELHERLALLHEDGRADAQVAGTGTGVAVDPTADDAPGTPVRLVDTLAALAALAHRETDSSGVLGAAASICAGALRAHVSVSLGSPVAPVVVATSSTTAQVWDGAQVAAGEGPSLEAHVSARVVASPSVLTDERWPRLHHRLPSEGGSAVAAPIESAGLVLGTLTAYAPAAATASQEVLGLLAVTLGGVLHEVELHRRLADLESDMERALASRSVIDQAKGIVMAKRGVDAETAWEHLVELSSTRHQKVRDIAQQIVSSVTDQA